eukprot:1534125-Pleurochrysis_carterae.AAC.3
MALMCLRANGPDHARSMPSAGPTCCCGVAATANRRKLLARLCDSCAVHAAERTARRRAPPPMAFAPSRARRQQTLRTF